MNLSLDTSRVFISVTIGIGAFIHISKAYARDVYFGFTSCIIFFDAKLPHRFDDG